MNSQTARPIMRLCVIRHSGDRPEVEMVSAVRGAHPITSLVQKMPGTSFDLDSRITYLILHLLENVNNVSNKMTSYVTRVIDRKRRK